MSTQIALSDRPAPAQPLRCPGQTFARPFIHVLPELRSAETALREAVLSRAGFEDVALREGAARDWRDVLIGQVSAHAYARRLSDAVQILAAPRYRAPASAGPFDASALVVRAADPATGLQDLRGRACAIALDDRDSAVRLAPAFAAAARQGQFFSAVMRLPTTLAAIQALAAGETEAAVIDGVALAHVQRLRPTLAGGLRVLLWSSRSPGPPLVTSRATPPEIVARLRQALESVERDPALAPARNALLIDGFNHLRAPHYRAALHLEQIAEDLGYAELA